MAHFTSGITDSDTFGKNEYRRSTVGLKYDSATLAAASVEFETVGGANGGSSQEKILQSGEVLAKITSGADAGKVGPFQADVTDGRQNVDNIVGVNDTFAPWQLLRRDIEVGVCYAGTLVQGKCFTRDADGKRIPLSDTVAAALVAKKNLNITFR